MSEDVQKIMDEQEQETLVKSIKNLMKNLKMTIEQAMDALGIPDSERKIYINRMTKSEQ